MSKTPMARQSIAAYVPPFHNVRLVECRDFIALTPVPALREFFGYGKMKARDFTFEGKDGKAELFWDDCTENEECWVVVQWVRFEDGQVVEGNTCHIRSPPGTEKDAQEAMRKMIHFQSLSRKQLEDLTRCFRATKDDYAYIDSRWPNYQSPPTGPNSIDALDLYQARLKALAGLAPATVKLIQKVDACQDPKERRVLEREAVDAYFAEVARYWPKAAVLAWQRTNPIETEWMRELVRVSDGPKREVDPVNYELALNWLRKKLNLLSASELSRHVEKATGQAVKPGTLKKRRERLGLTTKHPAGRRPKSE